MHSGVMDLNMQQRFIERRHFLNTATLAAGGLIIGTLSSRDAFAKDKEEKEVGAVEDLMREHGVLRRALLIYHEAAKRLRERGNVPIESLRKTAQLFRHFGEDYHERQLEETHIFPIVRKLGSAAAAYPDILTDQHNRGREITDYILSIARGDHISPNNAEPLARALDNFVLMYEHHTAREDTIVFTAWKKALSELSLKEIGDKFEEIEHKTFGKDGFDEAVATVAGIEQAFGIEDIRQFTAPLPQSSPSAALGCGPDNCGTA